jgi:hypothetical protein
MMVGLFGTAFSYFLLPALFLRGLPMRAKFYDDGVFWVTGCSPAFLDGLAASLAEQRNSAIELDESALFKRKLL